MTSIRVRGVNRVTAKGRVYHYHRATGARLQSDPSNAAAFAAEVAALDAVAPKPKDGKPGTVGGLIATYKAAAQFAVLKPDTQKGYRRGFDCCRAIDAMPIHELTQPFILALQERVYKKHGRWLANMTVKVLSVALGWGLPRGICLSNPAKGIPMIRRRTGQVANKAWLPGEVDAALKLAKGGLRKGIALAYFGGLRKKDVVELEASARGRREIEMTQSKTGQELTLFEAKRLSRVLDEKDAKPGRTIVVNTYGEPYTRDGFDSVFDKLKRKLVKDKLIRPGLTFHGLRKSLGKRAADMGASENDIAAVLGQSNPASARPYTIEAARKIGAKRVIRALDKRT
jgi:integrase